MDHTAIREHVESALARSTPDFGTFFLAQFLDLEFSYNEDERSCTVHLPYAPMLLNPQGSVHGGILSTLLDVSMGHLCHRFLSTAVTLEMHTRFLRPVTSDCRAVGRLLKPGRTIVHLESRIYDAEERLSAFASGSWHRI